MINRIIRVKKCKSTSKIDKLFYGIPYTYHTIVHNASYHLKR